MLDVVAPLAAGGSGTLYHVAVAAYSDFLRVGTDLDLPDAVAAARRPITGEGMVDWQSAIEAGHPPPALEVGLDDWCVRSEARRVGKGWVRTCRSRRSPYQ